jgi:hypothetical protein
MTNTFRKHHKTIMWIIIVGTIVSFVYFLSPTARNPGGGGRSAPATFYGSINGEPISQQQFDAATQEARLVYRMSQGQWPAERDTSQTILQITYQRLFIEAKLKQMNMVVTDDAAARYTKELFGIPQDQAFPKDKFAEFVRKELNQAGRVGLEDFDHFVRNQVGQQLLLSLFGMNGQLITQKEAEFFFRRENEIMAVELARFPITNFTAKVTPTPQDIEDFYTKRQADYRLPEREQVNYIRFDATNYQTVAATMLAGMSNLEADIEHKYISADPAAFKDQAGNQLSADAAKARIKEDSRQSLAWRAAQTNAYDLVKRLAEGHDKDHPITKADLAKLAETNGLTVTTTAPFDQRNPPKDLPLPPQALAIVFQLEFGDPDDQYKLLGGTNGFYLVGLEQKLPSENQSLETVRAKVTEDYRNSKALELAKDAGARFAAAAKMGLDRGQTFDALCAAQGITPESLTPFALLTPSIPEMDDKNEFEFVARIVFELPVGQCSQFAPIPTGGFVAFVKSRTPLDDAIVQRDIPAFLDKMRRDRQVAAFNQWLGREMRLHVVPMTPKSASPS